MRRTTSIITSCLLAALPSAGCTNFGATGNAPGVSNSLGAPAAVSQVNYEESVQRGQSPSDETAPANDITAAQPANAWWDPLAVGRKTMEITGNTPENQALAKQLFVQAETLYEAGLKSEAGEKKAKLSEAAGIFKRAARYHQSSALEEDALMYSAECHFFLDEYPDATKQYNELIKKYPNTKHLDVIGTRRFKLARYWLDRYSKQRDWAVQPNLTDEQLPLFDRFGNAVKLFDLIRLDDPTGELADDATLAAANAHFREGHYESADKFYTDLRQNFPTSEHQFTAHYLGVVTKLKVYQGPEYDGTPLDDAETLLTRIKRQFPDKSQENLDIIEKLDQDIRAAQAQRLWYMAAFYDRRREYAGARHYYEKIVDQFPSSNMADAAQKRMQEVQARPDSPAPPAKFLVEWLDRKEDLPQASAVPLSNSDTMQR